MHIRNASITFKSKSVSFFLTTTMGEAHGHSPGFAFAIIPSFKYRSISFSTNSLRWKAKERNLILKGVAFPVSIVCSTAVVNPKSSSFSANASRQRSITPTNACLIFCGMSNSGTRSSARTFSSFSLRATATSFSSNGNAKSESFTSKVLNSAASKCGSLGGEDFLNTAAS